MPQTINTNIPSLNAQRNLNKSQGELGSALERLSSGLRINSAKDDAAGLSISNRFTSQINGLNQAMRNANDGISLALVAEGALAETTNILQRLRDLSVQSANSTNTGTDRASIQAEANQLVSEIQRIATTTSFNGLDVLTGDLVNQQFQVGANANQTIQFSVASSQTTDLGVNLLETSNTNGIQASTRTELFITDGAKVGVGTDAALLTTAGGTQTGQLSAAGTQQNNVGAQTISVQTIAGTNVTTNPTITTTPNQEVSDVVTALNAARDSSGHQVVYATGSNTAIVNNFFDGNGDAGIHLVLEGKTLTSANGITTAAAGGADLAISTALRNEINTTTGLANLGISATLSGNDLVITRTDAGDLDLEVVDSVDADASFDVDGTNITDSLNNAASTITKSGQFSYRIAEGYKIASTVANGIMGAVDVESTFVSNVSAENLTVRDADGTVVGTSVAVTDGQSAEDVATALTALSGVEALGYNSVAISNYSDDGSGANDGNIRINNVNLMLALADNISSADALQEIATAVNASADLEGEGIYASYDAVSGELNIISDTGKNLTLEAIGTNNEFDAQGLDATTTVNVDATDKARVGATFNGELGVALKAGYTIETDAANANTILGTAGADTAVTTTAVGQDNIAAGNNTEVQTISITGYVGSSDITISQNATAENIARLVNNASSATGVTASAATSATISNLSAAGTISFQLTGENTTAVEISATISTNSDLSNLVQAINDKTGATGVSAAVNVNDGSQLTLTNTSGKDIVIADFNHSNAVDVTLAADVTSNTTAESNEESIMVTGSLGSSVSLYDGGIRNGLNSTVIGGEIQFSSTGSFAVSSNIDGGDGASDNGNGSLFSGFAGTAATSSLSSLNTLDMSTIEGANVGLAIIDASLSQVDRIRGNLGAVQNRLNSTIANLSTTFENLSAARGRILDADFALETAALTKAQILQQAGISILAQANQLPQQALSLLG